jgi:hypothetical protein
VCPGPFGMRCASASNHLRAATWKLSPPVSGSFA